MFFVLEKTRLLIMRDEIIVFLFYVTEWDIDKASTISQIIGLQKLTITSRKRK